MAGTGKSLEGRGIYHVTLIVPSREPLLGGWRFRRMMLKRHMWKGQSWGRNWLMRFINWEAFIPKSAFPNSA